MTGGIVVVLGQVGRNFGAGMSGGIAYILDEEDKFKALYNPEMIELEKIKNNDEATLGDNLLEHDKERLRQLINNHFMYTNSPKAKNILDNFDNFLPKFIKVMPTEYKKVLIKMYEKNDQPEKLQRGNQ
jgi:glutamate synthase domain-containing protein 3